MGGCLHATKAWLSTVGILLSSTSVSTGGEICLLHERQKLIAEHATPAGFFGNSVAVSDAWVIIGAPYDDTAGVDSGAAYLFRRDDNGSPSDPDDDIWCEMSKLISTTADVGDRYGFSVAISGDRLIVGAPWDGSGSRRPGSAYVYRRDDGGTAGDPLDDAWVEEASLIPSGADASDWFGVSVSISGDRVIVGASYNIYTVTGLGSAYVFRRDDGNTPLDPSDDSWVEEVRLTSPNAVGGEWFGASVSISGDRAIVGAAYTDNGKGPTGSAYVFRHDDNTTPTDPSDDSWIEEAKLDAQDAELNDYFGFSTAISGDRAMIGAVWDGAAGDRSGSVYTFRRDNRGTPSNPRDDTWIDVQKITAPDGSPSDSFGYSVSLSGTLAIVGAYLDDDACVAQSRCNSGSAHAYRCEDNGTPLEASDDFWVHVAKYTAGDAEGGDTFGISVSISGTEAVVGAPRDFDAGFQSGSAYFVGVRADDSEDCTGNGIPDECESDCNANGEPDDCDISAGVSTDCNLNAIPDECDLSEGASLDCDGNGIPDECQRDCNDNGLDDACDIAEGVSEDCQPNDIPDECESDCNSNGVPDECDVAKGIALPCAKIEFAPAGSSGPFQIQGNEIFIPAGDVQVEFEILLSGWGNAPGNPQLLSYNVVFEGSNLLGVAALPPNAGVDITTPLAAECSTLADCPELEPPFPVTQSGACGVIFPGWCDDFEPAFFVPNVCADDLLTPCRTNENCAAEVGCVDHPRFVFPSNMEPFLGIIDFGENWYQWLGLPLSVSNLTREDPDGVTRFVAANLRLIVPEAARGTYLINFQPSPQRTFITDSSGLNIPSAIFDGRLTIGGACCMVDGSCETLLEAECGSAGGAFLGGGCAGKGEQCIMDCNSNGIDDVGEFTVLLSCLAGPGRTPGIYAAECQAICLTAFDVDDDLDVDLQDFRVFQATFTGAR